MTLGGLVSGCGPPGAPAENKENDVHFSDHYKDRLCHAVYNGHGEHSDQAVPRERKMVTPTIRGGW